MKLSEKLKLSESAKAENDFDKAHHKILLEGQAALDEIKRLSSLATLSVPYDEFAIFPSNLHKAVSSVLSGVNKEAVSMALSGVDKETVSIALSGVDKEAVSIASLGAALAGFNDSLKRADRLISQTPGEIFAGYISRFIDSVEWDKVEGLPADSKEKEVLDGLRNTYRKFQDSNPENDKSWLSLSSFHLGVYAGLLSLIVGEELLEMFSDDLVSHASIIDDKKKAKVKSEQGTKGRATAVLRRESLMLGLAVVVKKLKKITVEGLRQYLVSHAVDGGVETGVTRCPEMWIGKRMNEKGEPVGGSRFFYTYRLCDSEGTQPIEHNLSFDTLRTEYLNNFK